MGPASEQGHLTERTTGTLGVNDVLTRADRPHDANEPLDDHEPTPPLRSREEDHLVRSEADFDRFQQSLGDEYRRLDAELEDVAGVETFLGAFDRA